MSLTNREHGHIERLQERIEVLRARVRNAVHKAHYVIEWERELRALEWATVRLNPPEPRGGEVK